MGKTNLSRDNGYPLQENTFLYAPKTKPHVSGIEKFLIGT